MLKNLVFSLAVFALHPSFVFSEQPQKTTGTAFEVPYRLTELKHILIRAKINGKGPYNFILDTGAPALFVSKEVCKKLEIDSDKEGWGTFEKFEIEGGVKIAKARGRIENPFQLEGMNSMGLGGVELHGVIGYNILARYKLEFDFTKDVMKWTALDFKPKTPLGLGGRGGSMENEAMAGLVKMMSLFIGKKPLPVYTARGFLGVEIDESKDAVRIKSVIPDSPAAKAGFMALDTIAKIDGKPVKNAEDLSKILANLATGKKSKVTILRKEENKELTVTLGDGL